MTDHWLLPEGIEELLPNQARNMEKLRRRLLDLFEVWGYELIVPPIVEYTESLLVGMGHDLDERTFKLVDQKSGRAMGIRADITPQVARIDAHQIAADQPSRLCYVGTVLQTQADELTNARSVEQIGAELYGHSGLESDAEVIELMLYALKALKLNDIYIDIGHVGVFRGLANQAKLTQQQETTLFDAMQRKATPEIETLVSDWGLDPHLQSMLLSLVWLNGEADVLHRAANELANASDEVHQALSVITHVAEALTNRHADLSLHFDLAELRGYRYHTGLVFAAYKLGIGQAIAKGGRYDSIGEIYGRSRPATGFSADLLGLMSLTEKDQGSSEQKSGVYAPCNEDPALMDLVERLRSTGRRVVKALPGQSGDAESMGCNQIIEKQGSDWIIKDF